MNLECCSTLNRKNSENKKEKERSGKIKAASAEQKNHPQHVNCSYIGCNTTNLMFNKIEKIARIGTHYKYFCNEFCYKEWLSNPSLLWL